MDLEWPEAPALTFPALLSQMRANTLKVICAFAQTNQRVLGELIELSSSVAKESLRAYAELQSAAIKATETATVAWLGSRESIGGAWRNPFAWYRKSRGGSPTGSGQAGEEAPSSRRSG